MGIFWRPRRTDHFWLKRRTCPPKGGRMVRLPVINQREDNDETLDAGHASDSSSSLNSRSDSRLPQS